MGKIIFVIAIILLLNLSLANAITPQEINEAKDIIDSKVDCKSLSDSQLEIIGEYEMELMHPGDSHEAMHKMMGLKEGDEPEKQFHINMAKTIYCGESGGMMGSGMMNMMGGVNMMGSGMMGNFGYGMMGGLGYGYGILFWVIQILIIVILALLAVWLYQKVTERRR
ncbi:hypothetical protein HYX17_04045 [Candidatus Woesearchaeota archaeon]|nr:hypothetical protein [Candidatus Woesearchaeota archaeon]